LIYDLPTKNKLTTLGLFTRANSFAISCPICRQIAGKKYFLRDFW
jgi:hypothetical protein